MKIRRASEADVEALVHFNQAMALETEGRELDRLTLEGGVRGLLNQTGYGFYLVAESEDGEIAGGLMVTFEWSDWRASQYYF